jgi:hypothetical protein
MSVKQPNKVGKKGKKAGQRARQKERREADAKVEAANTAKTAEAEARVEEEAKVAYEADQKRKRKLREKTRKDNARYLNKPEILRDFIEAREDPLASVKDGSFKNLREVVHIRANCNFYHGSDGKIVIKSGSCGIGETHLKCMMCCLVNENDAIHNIHEFNLCELCEVVGVNAEFWEENFDNFPLDKGHSVHLLKVLTEQGWWDV